MKISIVGPVYPFRGGIAHYNYHLYQSLISNGHVAQVFSFISQYPNWLYPGITDRDTSKKPFVTPAAFSLKPFSPWTWVNTAKSIELIKPDLVVIHWWTTFWSLAFTFLTRRLKRKGVRVIYLIHNIYPHERHRYDAWLTKKALASASGYIVQSVNEMDRLKRLFPDYEPVIRFSPLPVYFSFSEEKISQQEARIVLGLPKNAYIILFFGLVRPYKGLRQLIEAIGLLKSDSKQIHLVIAGEFWDNKEEYIRKIKEAGLENQVTIHDHYIENQDVPLYFSAADVFVAPYSGGTQSAALSVAMGFGIPIVSSDHIAQNLNNTEQLNLKVFPNGNIKELASSIQDFVNMDPELLKVRHAVENNWPGLIEILVEFSKK